MSAECKYTWRLDSVAGDKCIVFLRDGAPMHTYWLNAFGRATSSRWAELISIYEEAHPLAKELGSLVTTLHSLNVSREQINAAIFAFLKEKECHETF